MRGDAKNEKGSKGILSHFNKIISQNSKSTNEI
jgi:hypothetical protein